MVRHRLGRAEQAECTRGDQHRSMGVYVVPTDITPKSLILGQMVGYKTVPLNRFVP